MARIAPIAREQLSPEQLGVNDAIQALRNRGGGLAGGPFGVLLANPALADKAASLYQHLRREIAVPQRLCELAILVTARAWTAQYEWYAHEKHAVPAGLDPSVLVAIRQRRTPEFVREDEQIVYQLATELQERRVIADATYRRARDLLGEAPLVELVALIGFYTMLAIVLVGFEVDTPPDFARLSP